VPRHLTFYGSIEFAVAAVRGDFTPNACAWRASASRSSADAYDERISMINLIDAELAAGDLQPPPATGRPWWPSWPRAVTNTELTMARLNLCAALLALGRRRRGPPVAEAGWSRARTLQAAVGWADYLALLSALEQRPVTAARLCGYSMPLTKCGQNPRSQRSRRLRPRLAGSPPAPSATTAFERLQAEGRSLRDEDIAAIAFGSGDA
jgi:hypothetical protein